MALLENQVSDLLGSLSDHTISGVLLCISTSAFGLEAVKRSCRFRILP
jgi:hypothetical protein